MSKRKLNAMQAQIDSLQGQVSGLIKTVTELLPVRPMKPKLKTLDQSIFNGLDEKWRFAAVDEGGAVFKYEVLPKLESYFWSNVGGSSFCMVSKQRTYDASNWQNSLIERDTAKELTGSDLCRAMLARGDKFVMCLVADDSKSIMPHQEPSVVILYDKNEFYTRDSYYSYAVPINNQGKPLTASEVGL